MQISLSDWREVDGQEQTVTESELWDSVTFQGQTIGFKGPVQLSFHLTSSGSSLLVRGEIAAEMELTCSRCTAPFVQPVRYKVSEIIPLNPGDDPDGYWTSLFLDQETDELDLSEFSLMVLLENFPLQPLCRRDCRGLCTVCGQDLNQGDCDCATDQIDPRWAKLGQLLEKGKK